MRFSSTIKHTLVGVSVTLFAFQGAHSALAQFMPLGNQDQGYQDQGYVQNQGQSAIQSQSYVQNQGYAQNQGYTQPSADQHSLQLQPSVGLSGSQNYVQQQAAPQYVASQYPTSQYPASQYQSQQVQSYQPASQYQTIAPQYQAATTPYQPAPQYTAMAYLGADTTAIAPSPPAEVVGPGIPQVTGNGSGASAGGYDFQSTGAPAYPGGGYAPASSSSNYNTFDPGYSYTNAGGGAGVCYTGAPRRRGRRWFGGFYGLYMERAGRDWLPLAFSSANTNAPPYYPTDTDYVLNLQDVDNNYQGGAEIRIGATFGGGVSNNPCDGTAGCGPTFAWEAVYWGLVDEQQTFQVNDLTTDMNRLYGMIDFRGLEYSPTGQVADYRSVNTFYDYAPPSATYAGDTIEVRSLRARSNFSVQNIELNFLRIPLLGGGVGGCDSCAGGGSRLSVTTLVGARYMRIDDDFMFRTDYENITTPATGFLAYDLEADNHLVGIQTGFNADYRVGHSGRWTVHCNTAVGVYGNYAELSQRIDVPTGGAVRFVNGTNAAYNVQSDDEQVAVIGELRLGTSYQYSANWRLYSGYRLMGVSGVALATNQLTSPQITPSQVGYIATNGSLFLHGLRAGVEYTY